MSIVVFKDMDKDGKPSMMQCEQCLGIHWRKTSDFTLDDFPPTILGTEYQCVQCGKKSCLLFRNPELPPIPDPFN